MSRVFRIFSAFLLQAVVFVGAGCTTAVHRPPAIAVAVRPVGGRPPSPEEIQRIHDALRTEFTRLGASLAPTKEGADFVVTVDFVPGTDSAGPRIKVIGIEPTSRFREATDGGDTFEAKEWRRRQREMEAWAERQGRGLDT